MEEGRGGRADTLARAQQGVSKDSFVRSSVMAVAQERSVLADAEKGGFQGWFSREGGAGEGERKSEREGEREGEREREREREEGRGRSIERDLLSEEWGAGGRGLGGGGGGRNMWRCPVDRLRVEMTRGCGIGEGALVPPRETAFLTGVLASDV